MHLRVAARSCATLTALDSALDDALPYLFGLLGIAEGPNPLAQMDPQIKRNGRLTRASASFSAKA